MFVSKAEEIIEEYKLWLHKCGHAMFNSSIVFKEFLSQHKNQYHLSKEEKQECFSILSKDSPFKQSLSDKFKKLLCEV